MTITIENLEKIINSALTTNVNKSEVKFNQLYVDIKIENLISNILETELLIKKNSVSSINIISDFIITKSN